MMLTQCAVTPPRLLSISVIFVFAPRLPTVKHLLLVLRELAMGIFEKENVKLV